MCVIVSFPCRSRRQFIEFAKVIGVELLRSLRRREGEGIRNSADPSLPLLDPKGILRSAVHGLARDHHFARYRRLAGFDPELPVGVEVAKSQVLAFLAVDHPAANVLGLHHIGDENVIGLRQEKVTARQGNAMTRPERI